MIVRVLILLALVAPSLCIAQTKPPATPPPEWILKSGAILEGRTARPLRYWPQGTDFVITNGGEFFNRPLYCLNTAFRIDAGDMPELSLYLPGRGGNLRLGIKSPAGTKWLHQAEKIVTRYRPGSMIYEISDPLLGDNQLTLTVLPMGNETGMIGRIESKGTNALELFWAFGGANGERFSRNGDIGCSPEPVNRLFQLRPEQCQSNVFVVASNTFTVTSARVKLGGIFPPETKLILVDAGKWNQASNLLNSAGKNPDKPVLIASLALATNETVYFALKPKIETAIDATNDAKSLLQIFTTAEEHRRAIAEQVAVTTPDPFINAAAAAICVASDGVYDEAQGAYMHGAVAWRNKLLGWRGPYTADALGWHDRAERHLTYWGSQQVTNPIPDKIPLADPTSNLSRNEPALHSNGTMSKTHYDMNLVYIDALFRHFLWTGDIEFARQEWPVIERHLAWERRLFRREFGADKLPLYEAYAAIWASDDMQYHGGGTTHTTAYNYYHNKMAARMAALLGKDATPYEREAELILKAAQRELWLPDRGWFAEWKDYLGLQSVHPNAGLWTFYHAIDSELPTPMEAWEMTRFVDTQIAHIPVHGPGVSQTNLYTLPTTSWMPYTWSLNNVVMAEVVHTSLAYWQAGRGDEAMNLFKGSLLDSMFMGLCPGNAGMTTYFDMARREAQRDFADAVGISSRTLVEGLFGVHPDVLAGELRIRPGFPADWNSASIKHPDFSFAYSRSELMETFEIGSRFPKMMKVRLQIPALRDGIASVTINGQPAKWRALEESVGSPHVEIESAPVANQEIVVTWKGERPVMAKVPQIAARGAEFQARFDGATMHEITDPQGVLSKLSKENNSFKAIASGTPGHRTVFAKLGQGELTWWQPVTFEIRPAMEVIPAQTQDAGHLRFRVRNNTAKRILQNATVWTGNRPSKIQLYVPALGESSEISVSTEGLLPGANPISIELGAPVRGPMRRKLTSNTEQSDSGTSPARIEGVVVNWKIKTAAKYEPIEISAAFNDSVTQIFRNKYLFPRSPFCSLAIPEQGIGSWCHYQESFDVDDSGIRKVAGKEGMLFLQGMMFRTPGAVDAKNIAFTSQWDNYPREVSVPLNGKSPHAYLLMAGSSNPMQSRFDNGEVTVVYADGSNERLALHNPTTWWPIDQDYFIDDFGFRRTEPIPPRVDLKTGTVRVLDVADFKGKGGKVPGGAAMILDLPLNPEKELKSLTVRTLANEVVIGLMGVTLAR